MTTDIGPHLTSPWMPAAKTEKCLQCPKLCKHKVITITIVPEGAAQSPFFYVLSLIWPILFGDFLAETLSFPQELKGLLVPA